MVTQQISNFKHNLKFHGKNNGLQIGKKNEAIIVKMAENCKLIREISLLNIIRFQEIMRKKKTQIGLDCP